MIPTYLHYPLDQKEKNKNIHKQLVAGDQGSLLSPPLLNQNQKTKENKYEELWKKNWTYILIMMIPTKITLITTKVIQIANHILVVMKHKKNYLNQNITFKDDILLLTFLHLHQLHKSSKKSSELL